MYKAISSKYTYKDSNVVINKLDIREEKLLNKYQKKVVLLKLAAINSLELGNKFDETRLKKIHKYLFEDIYYFAGEYRSENITKDNFRFAEFLYIEENIQKIMEKIDINELSKLSFEEFCDKISYYMTELNVLHPFREGNGRTIREFIRELIVECGYSVDFCSVDYDEILRASKEAVISETFQKDLLKKIIKKV